MRTILFRIFAVLAALCIAVLGWGYIEATRDPLVRQASVQLDDWPADEPPLHAVLISDIHVAGPDMPPERLRQIVRQINALSPDIVFIAGDLVSDKRFATHRYSLTEAIEPLRSLRSRLGTFAVLGNHDHWRDTAAAKAALTDIGARVIENDALRIGPFALGGLDDNFTGRANPQKMWERLSKLPGAKVVLSHSPDPFPSLPDADFVMLAGHTHCGQIVLPIVGAMAYMSAYGDRYACGLKREGRKAIIVGAGLGTSVIPLRIGAPPELWLVSLGPKARNLL